MNYTKQLLRVAGAPEDDHETLLRLIESGANVNARDGSEESALDLAAYKGHYKICKTLLEHGARINTMSVTGLTPLINAILGKHENVVRLLLEKGANPNLKAGSYDSALNMAMSTSGKVALVIPLIQHGANIYDIEGKQTALHWACEKGHTKLVELLLHKGARIEALNGCIEKPVDIAKSKNCKEIVDMFEKDFLLWLRLYHASKQGDYEECSALLEQGALVDSSQFGLYCPVRVASKKGHSQIVKLLLEKGAKINYKDDDKRNPLYLATKRGRKDVVSLLLDAGGNVNFKVNGESLINVATRNNNEEIVHLLNEKQVGQANIYVHAGSHPRVHRIE